MKKTRLLITVFIITVITSLQMAGCSKSGDSTQPPTTPPTTTDPCAGKTITVSATATESDACGSATVTVTATGSTGFTYSINGTNYQASNIMQSVTAGSYTVSAKDNAGCIKTTSLTVNAVASGPLFAAVKNMMQTSCVSCHAGAAANGGKDFTSDCVILSSSDRIKARAIDGNPSFMPQGGQLSAADKKKITDWIAAGAKYSN